MQDPGERDLYFQAKAICLDLVTLPADQRVASLEEKCAGQPALRSECLSILESFDTETDDFLPALQVPQADDSITEGDVMSKVGDALMESLIPGGAVEPIEPGQVLLERYQIERRLGAGGMGEVWSAWDKLLGETIALKRIHRRAIGSLGGAAQDCLLAEASAARKIMHPGVCRIHDVGKDGDGVFMSMEYISGGDLRERIRRGGALDAGRLRILASQVASALEAIHAGGILHRDLKPANILFHEEGQACISDFGLASEADAMSGRDHRSGTGAYMAPELLEGGRPSKASDMFAYGLLLYEAATGRRCFLSSEDIQRVAKGEQTIVPPSSYTPGLDPVLERLILRCLAVDAEQRPQSAGGICEVLALGDPIDAVIALGELPDARVISMAPVPGVLSKAQGWAGFALIVLLLAAIGLLGQGLESTRTGDSLAYQERLQAAHAMLRRLGQESDPGARQYLAWADLQDGLLDSEWRPVETETDSKGLPFWYRESADALVPTHWVSLLANSGRIGFADPPRRTAGVTSLLLDGSGRLVSFVAGKKALDVDEAVGSMPDWNVTFSLAGLGSENFGPATYPNGSSGSGIVDVRWASNRKGDSTEVHARSLGKQIMAFEVVRWMPALEEGNVSGYLNLLLIAIVFACMIPVAIRHIRAGRGDIGGAMRLAAFAFVSLSVSWFLVADLPKSPALMILFATLGISISVGGMVGVVLLFLALEPFSQRYWPRVFVSWGRGFQGMWGNPLVRSHILIGIGLALVAALARSVVDRWGSPMGSGSASLPYLGEPVWRAWLAEWLGSGLGALLLSLEYLAVLVVLHAILRNKKAAVLLTAIMGAAITAADATTFSTVLLLVTTSTLGLGILLQFGLLPSVIFFLVTDLLAEFPAGLPGMGFGYEATAIGLAAASLVLVIGPRTGSEPVRAKQTARHTPRPH